MFVLTKKGCPAIAGIAAILFYLIPHALPAGKIGHAGIMGSIEEIGVIFTGIQAFASRIIDFTSAIGIATIVLFLAVLVLSSGLTMLGVPRGRASFLMSLLIADGVWFAWSQSFHPGSAAFLPGLMKSNILLLSPMAAVALTSFLWSRGVRFYLWRVRPFLRKKRGHFTKKEILRFIENYQRERDVLERSLIQDLGQAADGWVAISPETSRSLESLKKALTTMEAPAGKDNE